MNIDAKILSKIQQYIKKNNTLESSGIYSRDVRMVQYSLINKHNTSHK